MTKSESVLEKLAKHSYSVEAGKEKFFLRIVPSTTKLALMKRLIAFEGRIIPADMPDDEAAQAVIARQDEWNTLIMDVLKTAVVDEMTDEDRARIVSASDDVPEEFPWAVALIEAAFKACGLGSRKTDGQNDEGITDETAKAAEAIGAVPTQ